MLYAELPARRARQVAADLAVLGWVLLCAQLGRAVHRSVSALAAPGRDLEAAGQDLSRSLDDAARRTGEVPLIGDSLAGPLEQAGGAARRLAEAGAAEQTAAGRLALLLGLAVALVPVLLVVGAWLPARLRWARRAGAAARLREQGEAGTDLLAVRALAERPVGELLKVDPQPATAWRTGDSRVTARLAALELARLGLREPTGNQRSAGRQRV